MIFKRYELKFFLTGRQKDILLDAMRSYMALDAYGRSTIRNIYFDTPSYRLIRQSIERPAYKEKLRVRSYFQAEGGTPVYIELKKKYRSIVYKRRLELPEEQAMDCLLNIKKLPLDTQIAREIDYFRQYYQGLAPVAFISYEREAYYDPDGSDFRITFDENILYRTENLSLQQGPYGTALLPPGQTLMELKTSGGIPLWMTHVLNQNGIFKSSFSKYGAAYKDILTNNGQGELIYA